ncbi:MAG: MoxR family ATPase [Gammaproteobacteria bacterium]|nr:MoxR family ATPase [Gammaproteobacteria bacterium]
MSEFARFSELRDWLGGRIVGQPYLVDRLLMALLADGHLLVEGPPGLAKTRAIRSLAEGIHGSFQRIQFTPDLLPGDVTGTDIFRPQTSSFEFQSGPIFHNLVLADEINRAPAKVQSALLEAMAERQVSVGKTTYNLPELFMVMATQNPIEQEGTYPLPEAQLDRFLMHVLVDYPNAETERDILRLVREEANDDQTNTKPDIFDPLTEETVKSARQQVLQLHMADAVEEYMVQLVMATRQPEVYDEELATWLDYGGSPRATLSLDRCARAHAWLRGNDFVAPDDVQSVAHDVLRHRIITSFQAEANGIDTSAVIDRLLSKVPVA